VPVIASALLDDVNYAPDSAAVLRFEAAGLYLNFLDKLKDDVLLNAATLNFRGVQALNQVGIFRVAGAIYLETIVSTRIVSRALQRFLTSAWSKRNQRLIRTPFGNVFDNVLGNRDRHFTRRDIHEGGYDAAYNGLGVAFMGTGDSKAARPAFEKAISLNENFAEAYRNLARISLAERKFDEVDQLLMRSLSTDALNPWALAYSAYAELQLRKFDEALAHARKAHEGEHKGLASVHIVAALALEAKDKKAEAVQEYRKYLEEDPNGRDAPRAKEKLASLEIPSKK
jgi:tetratricopeptide (TPR) repeat protein